MLEGCCSPSFPPVSERRDPDSPTARQEFMWTEEKRKTLEPGPMKTWDRLAQMKMQEERDPLLGYGNPGYQTAFSFTWLRAAVHSSRERSLNRSPIQRLCVSEIQL